MQRWVLNLLNADKNQTIKWIPQQSLENLEKFNRFNAPLYCNGSNVGWIFHAWNIKTAVGAENALMNSGF